MQGDICADEFDFDCFMCTTVCAGARLLGSVLKEKIKSYLGIPSKCEIAEWLVCGGGAAIAALKTLGTGAAVAIKCFSFWETFIDPVCLAADAVQFASDFVDDAVDCSTGICTDWLEACDGSCINHDHKQCSGGDLYWYDSCGNQEEMAQDCECGCDGSACLSPCCNTHEYTECSGDKLYWYDSCHNQEDVADNCEDGNPCTDDTCIGDSCSFPTASDGTNCGAGKVCQNGACIEACNDEFEPNNSCSAAATITAGSYYDLNLAWPNDDYYKIQVGAGKTLDVGISTTSGYFWQLYLHDANCSGAALDYWESSSTTVGATSWTNNTGSSQWVRIWVGANTGNCDMLYDLFIVVS